MIVWIIILGLVFVGIVLERNGTVKRQGWKLIFIPLSCPRCHTRPPLIRIPGIFRSFNKSVCGAWTCETCGTEVDTWGHEIAPPTPDRNEWSGVR
jgi:hypothetical protein